MEPNEQELEPQVEEAPDKILYLEVTEEQQRLLLEDFDDADVSIRPDGLIYLPHTFFRERLTRVFGAGAWRIIQVRSWVNKDENILIYHGRLYIKGIPVTEARGEQSYGGDWDPQNESSAWESAKSDCIVRCCKDLSIASKLWQPHYIDQWKAAHAVKVFVKNKKGDTKVQWRHVDSLPFYGETGVCEDSPNQPKNRSTAPPKSEQKQNQKDQKKDKPATPPKQTQEQVAAQVRKMKPAGVEKFKIPTKTGDTPIEKVTTEDLTKMVEYQEAKPKEQQNFLLIEMCKYAIDLRKTNEPA